MSKFKSCFVDGCFHNEENSSHLFHRFPTAGKRNSQRVNTWAEFSKPEAPLDSSEIQKLYMRQVFICGAHFTADSYQEVNPSKLHIHSIPKIPPSSIPSSSYPIGSPSLYPPQPSPQYPPTPPSDSSSDQFPSTSSDGPLPMDIDPVIPSAPPELPLTCPGEICSSDSTPTSAPEIPQPQLDPQNTPVTPESSTNERSARLTASNKTPVSKRSLLKDLNVTRFNKLTPRKQRLLLSNRRKERSLKRMKDQIKNLKVRTSKTVIDLPAFKNFPPALKLLIESTLRIGNCKPKGRRWTLEDKIQALTLHKNSPKNYALLRTFFPLPSARTLRSVLSKVPFSPGICQPVLDALKKSVAAMNPLDRYCTLMFDEISLRQQLWYNRGQDRIEGFQDHKGQGVSSKLADHGLVFMIQGLRRHYKQPVAYYLSHSATTAERLVIFIKNVIRACRDAGLHIASTVCDLGTSNVSALKKLGATPEEPYFYLDEEEKGKIHTILDPCHLLKCTRNNLMTKDVTFTVDMNGKKETGTAKWSHIQKVAEEDKKLVFRKLAHIDDDDLNPDRCKKMKVAAAAHVLSHTVASAVEYEHRNGVLKDDPSAIFTAYFTKSVDDMFDSVNGRGMIPYKGKVLRTTNR
ncbi:uncharacterized protein [Bemisia tabaci]|uniref:uncharacterized protein n=1 Tax=Bemisia tabaci TaxID=7038 RepID=UPI003B2820FE